MSDRSDAGVLANYLDGERLKVIPRKHSRKMIVLHWLVQRFEYDVAYPEATVNAMLAKAHPDYATLRRELYDAYRMDRENGVYRRRRPAIALVKPAERFLPSYVAALRRGWSANTVCSNERFDELARIERDPSAFLAGMDDSEGRGPPITLPDGSSAPRLPGYRRWVWDGEFAGSIGLRWAPGTPALPPHCLGHIGYSIVPWKRRKGYATTALRLVLPDAAAVGLPYVEIVTDEGNVASQRVVLANGGVLVERFRLGPQYGGGEALRYRIRLNTTSPSAL